MDELRNFETAFSTYYGEINLDDISIEEKDINDYKKSNNNLPSADNISLQEKVLLKKVVDLRIENLKKTKESFSKFKLNLLIDDKSAKELNSLFDGAIESLSKIDVNNLTKDEIFKRFSDLQLRLDSKMKDLSISYVNKLVEEVSNSKDYNTFLSAKQSIDKSNLPKEAIERFNALTANYGKPEINNNQKIQKNDEVNKAEVIDKPVEEIKNDNVADVVDTIGTEQQAIENNEGSLERNNQQQTSTLEQRIAGIENNSTVKYGARVTEQIHEFNIDNDNKRIETLKQLREKKGKLTIGEAIELRTLVEKRELRNKQELNNSVANKVGDVLLASTNRKLEKSIEQRQIAQQKYNVTKSFFSKRKLNKLNEKIRKLQSKKGKLTSFEINSAMFQRNLKEKFLTMKAVKNNTSKRFVSVKEKIMSKIFNEKQNQDMDIILASTPTILDIQYLELSQSRTM